MLRLLRHEYELPLRGNMVAHKYVHMLALACGIFSYTYMDMCLQYYLLTVKKNYMHTLRMHAHAYVCTCWMLDNVY